MNANSPQIEYGLTLHTVLDDGVFPNNARFPLQLIRPSLPHRPSAVSFEILFASNGWQPAWRAGIFSFHHYHSTAHEVLGCYSGSALLQFGGAAGVQLEIQIGDAVVIPAGVAHRCIRSNQFSCVGAYPTGQEWDTCYGKPNERPDADQRIANLNGWATNPVGIDNES